MVTDGLPLSSKKRTPTSKTGPGRNSAWAVPLPSPPGGRCRSLLVDAARIAQLLYQVTDDRLGVAEEHPGPVGEVQLILDAGECGASAALDRVNRLGLVRLDDGHAV